MPENSLGLSRYVPAEVKRTVRQRCGFGCVICGDAIFQYDHMVTGFAEARVHAAEDITLLCGTHHQMKSAGSLSVETVQRANADPKCKQRGFSRGPFDIGPDFAELLLGTITCIHTTNIINIFGDRVLYLAPPEMPGGPMQINATLSDDRGTVVMQIVDNEWCTPVSNWDVAVQGPTITIRRGPADIVLAIRTTPPNRLEFERLHMFHRGVRIDCGSGEDAKVTFPDGTAVSTSGMRLEHSTSCIDVAEESVRVGAVHFGKDGMRLGGPGVTRVYGLRVDPPDQAHRAERSRQVDFLLRRDK